jgi:hypothetical protein
MTNSSGVLTTVEVCPGDDFPAAPSFPLIGCGTWSLIHGAGPVGMAAGLLH